MATEKIAVEIGVIDKFTNAFKEIQKQFQSGISGISLSTLGWTAAAGALAYGLKKSLDAAAEAEAQMAKFHTSMKNAGDISGRATEQILKLAEGTVKLGFDDEEAANAMATFYSRTKDVTTATKLNTLAMDLARAKNISLTDSARAINNVLSGSAKALKEYGIEIKDGQSPMVALKEAQDKLKDSAVEYSKTYQGQMEILNQGWGNFKEGIGKNFLPAANAVLKGFAWMVNELSNFGAKLGEVTGIMIETYKIRRDSGLGIIESLHGLGDASIAISNQFDAGRDSAIEFLQITLDGTENFNGFASAVKGGTSSLKQAQKAEQDLVENNEKLRDTFMDSAAKIKESAQRLKDDHNRAMADMEKETDRVAEAIKNLNKSYGKEEVNDKKNVAQQVIDQENKIAGITADIGVKNKDILEAQHDLNIAYSKSDNAEGQRTAQEKIFKLNEELKELQTKLDTEVAAKRAAADFIKSIDQEVSDARKYNALTELEQSIADYTQRRADALQEYNEKLADLNRDQALIDTAKKAELESYKTAQRGIKTALNETRTYYMTVMADQTRITDDFVKASVERFGKLTEAANAAVQAMDRARSAGASGVTSKAAVPPARAMGGPVSMGQTYMVGENGAEFFTPGANGFITPQGKGGSNITININGPVSSRDVAEEYGNMIIKQLQFHTKAV